MIIDSSAVFAILFAEDDAASHAAAIERAGGGPALTAAEGWPPR